MTNIKENHLIQKLLSLNLPVNDYAIFGSGPMFAHGLIEPRNDLDIIARNKAWEKAKQFGSVIKEHNDELVKLFDDGIEIGNSFSIGNFNISSLIDEAEIIEGIRFVRLENVIIYKKILNRPKDIEHIKLIEEYLNK